MDVARFKNEIAAVLIVLIFAFVVKGIKSNFDGQLYQLERRANEVNSNQKQLRLFNELDNRYRTTARRFPFNSRQILTSLIEQAAREYNLKIDNLRPITRDMNFYEEVKIEMGLSYPEYERLIAFLNTVESNNIAVSRVYVGPDKKCKLTLKGTIIKER